nr:sortase [Miniphocaeibacter massiliensis]
MPKIKITLPLYFRHSKSVLMKGARIMSRTSVPIGGENTNSVIAAHRGYKTQKMFKYIEGLQ